MRAARRESSHGTSPSKVTDAKRELVKALAGYGLKHEQIARIIGLRSPKTLRRYFRQELDVGGAQANAQVTQTLYTMATSGQHPAATMFWLKTRARWSERAAEEMRPAVMTPSLTITQEADHEPCAD